MIKNYPWNSIEDPNAEKIMLYIRNAKSRSTRKLFRERLTLIIRAIYEKYGVFPFSDYNLDELRQYLAILINSLKIRKQSKVAHFHTWNNLIKFLRLKYSNPNFDFSFNEQVYPWNSDLDDPNRPYIQKYLKSISNFETMSNHRKSLSFDFGFLYQDKIIDEISGKYKFGKKFILEYTSTEFIELFEAINKKTVKKLTKTRFRSALYKLIISIIKPQISEGKKYERNYQFIFSPEYFEFKETSTHRIKKNFITAKDYLIFLNEIRTEYKNTHDYILFRFFQSSCRGHGLCNIRIKDINLEIGFFDTLDKAKMGSSGKCRYFLPKDFLPEIRAYLMQQGYYNSDFTLNKFREDELLFDTTPRKIRERLEKVYKKPWRNHDFRRSIKRMWKRARMQECDQNTLSNHTQNSMAQQYSEEDPWNEPEVVQEIYQEYYNWIFILQEKGPLYYPKYSNH